MIGVQLVRFQTFLKELKERNDAKMRSVLKRFGAFVRQRDRSSLVYRKGIAQAGQPPSVHRTVMRYRTNKKTGVTVGRLASPLKEDIVFEVIDEGGMPSVIIGPMLHERSKPGILRIIEEGGEELTNDKRGRAVRRQYKPHPHTKPAFDAVINQELPKVLGTE